MGLLGVFSSIFCRRQYKTSEADTWISSGQLLPPTAVKICRLCLDVSDPSLDFYDPDPKLGKPSLIESKTTNFTEAQSRGLSGSLELQATKLATTSGSGSRQLSTKVESDVSTTIRLQNSTEYFITVCRESSDAREWLAAAVTWKRAVYMVIGIKTVVDAAVTVKQNQDWKVQGRATIPVSRIATGVEVEGGALDIGAEISLDRNDGATSSFTAPGEQIYAVQYRKVEFPRLSSRRSEKAMLEKGYRWKVYLGGRSGTPDCDAEAIEIEAGLGGAVDGKDLDCNYETLKLQSLETILVLQK